MSETQMLTVALATVPTFLAVLMGILINNHRLSDLRTYIDGRLTAEALNTRERIADLRAYMDQRLSDESRVHEARFKMLLDKMDDMDSRLTRLEERFAR